MRLRQRVNGLAETKKIISRIRERVRYASEPMEGLLSQFGIQCEGESAREQWEEQVVMWGERMGLSNEDSMILNGFIKGFGYADMEGEVRYCDEYCDVFEERIQEAQAALHSKGRVMMALWICGGLTMGLLLL